MLYGFIFILVRICGDIQCSSFEPCNCRLFFKLFFEMTTQRLKVEKKKINYTVCKTLDLNYYIFSSET